MKELLEERGRTRKWFIRNLNITDGTLRQYINGLQKPGESLVIRMAVLLDVPVAELDDEIGETQPPTRRRQAATA